MVKSDHLIAHGYRNEGGREVGVKRVLVFMFHQFFKKKLFTVAVKMFTV